MKLSMEDPSELLDLEEENDPTELSGLEGDEEEEEPFELLAQEGEEGDEEEDGFEGDPEDEQLTELMGLEDEDSGEDDEDEAPETGQRLSRVALGVKARRRALDRKSVV